ncbi:extracellular calcium-sensing receptor-like isoform X1 [Carassius carassius]|uniref:extracellular calcium-sensing receptor-like isoform X1 n=1 Tax=Carassius carassius TaxID=217509 RepID=UPI0028690C80|nr:extracellular calcium-sensing receptor-like isoform X1 [Carassius carassius]
MVKHFGWTWIGAVCSDSDYGNNGMASFLKAAEQEGICVEYSEAYYRTQPRSKLKRVADVIRKSSARVIVAFVAAGDMRFILEELSQQPPPPMQWIGSEAWVTDPQMLRFNLCIGAVGFAIPRSVIPGFRHFLLDMSPKQALKFPLLTEFWESSFSCSLKRQTGSSADMPACDGTENLRALQNPYTDTSQLRVTNMVYKATYAIAHALHSIICNKKHCDKNIKVEHRQVFDQLKRVNFTKNNYSVSFDTNGDPVATYELVNWQLQGDGSVDFATVGQYDASKPKGQEFSLSKSIIWYDGSEKVPVSVCSESCPPGTRKAVNKGRPICCYDCINCADGEVSNETASILRPHTCQLQGRFRLNGLYQDGDVILGGLFDVHLFTVFPELSFRTEPDPPYCEKFNMESFQHAQTMAFAIDEINKNPNLLPNITLGYHLYDNCVMLGMAFRAAISLASGTEESFSNLNCTGPPPVIGIVGDPGSTPSIAISSYLGMFRVPIVSHYATCSCLSDKTKYPSFFRTIPSDAFQVRAMVQILRHFGWTWVGLLYSDDDYGIYAYLSFKQEMQLFGGCVAFSEILSNDNNPRNIQRIIAVIQSSTARVVVVFSTLSYLLPLMDAVVLQNLTDRQWIASEAWATAPVFHTPHFLPFLRGTLGIAIRRGEIQGLHEFLLHLRPSNDPQNNMLRIFWENMFVCSFETEIHEQHIKNVCTGLEDLNATYTPYTDASGLRAAYNVYKAVYALAHALHDLMQCEEGKGPFSGNSCANTMNLKPWQVRPTGILQILYRHTEDLNVESKICAVR